MNERQEWELSLAKKYGQEAIRQIVEQDELYARIAATLASKHAMDGLRMRELPFPIRVGGIDGRR